MCMCVFARLREKKPAFGRGRNSECMFSFGYLLSFDLVLEGINYHSLNRIS
jgi:hypothetical protein